MRKEQQPHKVTVDIPQAGREAVRHLAHEHQRSFTKELVESLHEEERREQQKGAPQG